jgi:hypothetical protein
MHEPWLRIVSAQLADEPPLTSRSIGWSLRWSGGHRLRAAWKTICWWRARMSARRLRRDVPRLALNQTEAAEALGMSVDAFEEHVKPRVPCVYAGSRRLYPVSGLQAWLAEESVHGGRRVA